MGRNHCESGPEELHVLGVDAYPKDLDYGEATLENVQETILKFFAEQELPSSTCTDKGGQFHNAIDIALQQILGTEPCHIPPGRPQSNGLVEVFNRIMDCSRRRAGAAHGGCTCT